MHLNTGNKLEGLSRDCRDNALAYREYKLIVI